MQCKTKIHPQFVQLNSETDKKLTMLTLMGISQNDLLKTYTDLWHIRQSVGPVKITNLSCISGVRMLYFCHCTAPIGIGL
jgi:hypothetical protein